MKDEKSGPNRSAPPLANYTAAQRRAASHSEQRRQEGNREIQQARAEEMARAKKK